MENIFQYRLGGNLLRKDNSMYSWMCFYENEHAFKRKIINILLLVGAKIKFKTNLKRRNKMLRKDARFYDKIEHNNFSRIFEKKKLVALIYNMSQAGKCKEKTNNHT